MTQLLNKHGKSLIVDIGTIMDNNKSYPAKMHRRRLFAEHNRYLVYVIRDNQGNIIYIGSTWGDIRNRLSGHRSGKTALWKSIMACMPTSKEWEVELIPAKSRAIAYKIESNLINSLEPKLNDRAKSK